MTASKLQEAIALIKAEDKQMRKGLPWRNYGIPDVDQSQIRKEQLRPLNR